MPSHHVPLSRHHANSVAAWQISTRKKGQSRHHAMYHLHAIMPIILLLHESRLEKMANHAITGGGGGVLY